MDRTDEDRARQWCEPDDCPASICNGPHVSHPFCGWTA